MMSKQPRGEDDRSSVMKVIEIEDLLTLILLRLPVKSLLCFKSVSKHWLSLISNPKFCALKTKQCCKHISGILLNPRDMEDTLRFQFVPLDDDQPAPFQILNFVDGAGGPTRAEIGLDVLQYCNGLLLCETVEYSRSSWEKTKCYYVVNPATKQYSGVSFPVSEDIVSSVALAFDPRKSSHFKLICLFQLYGDDDLDSDFYIRVYSSETGLLTQLMDHFHASASDLGSEGCCFFWNGAVNWISYEDDGLYLNVDEERIGVLPIVPEIYIDYIGESNDHLYLVGSDTRPTKQIDVYEMDREYSGWFVKFRVDLRPMFREFPTESRRLRKAFSILAIAEEEDDEKSFIVFGRPGEAIRFHLKGRAFTRICQFSGFTDMGCLPIYDWTLSFQFIESLHPLRRMVTYAVLDGMPVHVYPPF